MTDKFTVAINRKTRTIMTDWGTVVDDEGLHKHYKGVCSEPELLGYNECIDFSAVETINVGTAKLSDVASEMISRLELSPKLAIVAPAPLAFGLARMYEAFHSIPGQSKQVYVFKRKDDAISWLEAPIGSE